MTLDKFVTENNIVGTFHEKIPSKRMKKVLNQFKYVDTTIYWYDDDEHPDDLTWMDIEGIGYGWLWFNHKNSKKLQRKSVIQYAMNLYRYVYRYGKNNRYYKSVRDDITEFWLEDDDAIYLIRGSNSELRVW